LAIDLNENLALGLSMVKVKSQWCGLRPSVLGQDR